MKLTKTQIVIGSLSAVAVGATIFFGFTKKGKELISKWFGKSEPPGASELTDTPEGKPSTTTTINKSDVVPGNTGIVAPKPKETPHPIIEERRVFPLGTWSRGYRVESVQKALNKFYKFTLPINGKMDNDTINSLTSKGYIVPLSKQQFNRLIVGLK